MRSLTSWIGPKQFRRRQAPAMHLLARAARPFAYCRFAGLAIGGFHVRRPVSPLGMGSIARIGSLVVPGARSDTPTSPSIGDSSAGHAVHRSDCVNRSDARAQSDRASRSFASLRLCGRSTVGVAGRRWAWGPSRGFEVWNRGGPYRRKSAPSGGPLQDRRFLRWAWGPSFIL